MKFTVSLVLLTAVVAAIAEDSSTTNPSSTTKKVEATTKKQEPKAKAIPAASAPAFKGADRPNVSDDQIEMALKDKRYLLRQLKCTLGEAPCDPVGRRLKTLAPLVLRNSCPQCTPQEMRQIQKVLSHVQRNFPKEWAKIVRSYQ